MSLNFIEINNHYWICFYYSTQMIIAEVYYVWDYSRSLDQRLCFCVEFIQFYGGGLLNVGIVFHLMLIINVYSLVEILTDVWLSVSSYLLFCPSHDSKQPLVDHISDIVSVFFCSLYCVFFVCCRQDLMRRCHGNRLSYLWDVM